MKDTIINNDKHDPLKNIKESKNLIIKHNNIITPYKNHLTNTPHYPTLSAIIIYINHAINAPPLIPEDPIGDDDLYDDEPARYRRPG